MIGWSLLLTFHQPFYQQMVQWTAGVKETLTWPVWWWHRVNRIEQENEYLRQRLRDKKLRHGGRPAVMLTVVETHWSPRGVMLVAGPYPQEIPVRRGTPVMGPAGGVVGAVLGTTPHYLIIESILSHRLPWVVSLGGQAAVIEWETPSRALLTATLPFSANVKQGDTAFVHPSFAAFSPGTPLGVVSRLQMRAREGVVRIWIQPIEDIAALSAVEVPFTPAPEEVDSVIKAWP